MAQEYVEGEALPWVILVTLKDGSTELVKVWSTNMVDAIKKATRQVDGIAGEVN